jgi:hypothetical protein
MSPGRLGPGDEARLFEGDHPTVASSLNNLAVDQRGWGAWAGAAAGRAGPGDVPAARGTAIRAWVADCVGLWTPSAGCQQRSHTLPRVAPQRLVRAPP